MKVRLPMYTNLFNGVTDAREILVKAKEESNRLYDEAIRVLEKAQINSEEIYIKEDEEM